MVSGHLLSPGNTCWRVLVYITLTCFIKLSSLGRFVLGRPLTLKNSCMKQTCFPGIRKLAIYIYKHMFNYIGLRFTKAHPNPHLSQPMQKQVSSICRSFGSTSAFGKASSSSAWVFHTSAACFTKPRGTGVASNMNPPGMCSQQWCGSKHALRREPTGRVSEVC